PRHPRASGGPGACAPVLRLWIRAFAGMTVKWRAGACSGPHRDARRGEVGFRLADAERAEMEDRGGEDRGYMAVADPLDEMVERSDAAGGDDRHPHRIRDRPGQWNIEARFRAVAVHR